MTFLSWQSALMLAGLAVPLLLLLYFLKLRRQERTVPSTLLWKKAVQDLQVNAPFQKLRKNLLLFLQLLLLAACLLALADPVGNFTRQPQKNIVLLVDRSASMNTVEADGRTRLEHARTAALEFVDNLPDESRAMVIAFGKSPSVVCTFTDDKRRLARLIDGIEPTEEPGRLAEALPLAVAYSSNLVDIPGASVPEAAVQDVADIEFFSDGRIVDADRQYVTRSRLRYYRIGAETDNVGITAFDVQRNWERPGNLAVFVQVQNFGGQPVTTDVSLSLDGKLLPGPGAIREVSLGPAVKRAADAADRAAANQTERPAAQNVLFEFYHAAGGVIEVKVHRADALAVDNSVMAPIDPPRRIRVLGVTDRSPVKRFLAKATDALDVEDYQVWTPGQYENAPDDELMVEARCGFDLVILDLHGTNRLPPGNYVFLGGAPLIEGVALGETVEGQPLIYGRSDHPLMRYVNYEGIFIAKWRQMTLPPHAVSLLEGSDSTVMAFLAEPGHRYLIASFDLLESNLALKEAFPILIQNAIGYLAAGGGVVTADRMVRPGDTLSAPAPPGATEARVRRPDGGRDVQPVRGGAVATYAGTQRAGLYEVAFDDAAKTTETFAANLLDATESNIAPNESFTVGSEAVESVSAATEVNEPLWPYFVIAAIVVLLLEWFIYNRRVMV